MTTTPLDLTRLGPEGGKRSSKRDRIVDVFLRQEGHLSADDLVDLIRREDQRISRATVYRTLQWMVDAGIARKVDFGEGRFRFEHSYRHPRHFHLICKTCNQSSEFLSSDIEALIEEVAAARHFTARQSVLQIYGECEDCRLGRRAAPINGATTELLFARDALRIAIATERSGLDFYTRAAAITRDARGRTVFQRLAEEEKDHLGTLEARYRVLLERDAQLESRPTFLFFKGAANGLFSEGRRTPQPRSQRPAGLPDRHPVRTRVAPLLQAVRREVRGLGRQADLPRVRRRGTAAPGPAHPRIQGAGEAAGPRARQAPQHGRPVSKGSAASRTAS